MSQFGWLDCPDEVRDQVLNIVDDIKKNLGDDLIGIYLHGSLAMGCFNPARSDIDLLVVTSTDMAVSTKRHLTEMLLSCSAVPCSVEISFLVESSLYPWEHPTPYCFHYSEVHRGRYLQALADGSWRQWNTESAWDGDLAAHITVTLARGIALYGEPAELVFPRVPPRDYADSIVSDLWTAREEISKEPGHSALYFILNACRVYGYLLEGQILSKEEGGQWALRVLPEFCRSLVRQALDIYRGDQDSECFDETTLQAFTDYMQDHIRALAQ